MSLAFGAVVLGDPTGFTLASFRAIDGKNRFKTIGKVDSRLWTAGICPCGEATMANEDSTIALKADPNDPEDFDVTHEAVEQALAERRARLAAAGEEVTLRIDRTVLGKFRASGAGWEARISAALREAAARL